MISNKKKSSIKSLDKNSMPLFDNIDNKNEEEQVNSKKSDLHKSTTLNTQNKNSQTGSSSSKPTKSLASINSISENKSNHQNQLGEKRSITPKKPVHNNTPNSIHGKPKTLNSISGNISLGTYLQEARVKTGYSMNQVAMITKLNIHYIEAIERDDFNNTPPLIYIKAYVKKLATLYKIDVEKALNLLKPPQNTDKQIPSTLIQELQETKQVNQKDEAKIKIIFQITTVALLVIIVICFIIGLIYWLSSGSSSDEPVKSSNVNTTSVVKTNITSTNLKPLTAEDKTEISKEMEKLIVPQSIKLTELPIPQK